MPGFDVIHTNPVATKFYTYMYHTKITIEILLELSDQNLRVMVIFIALELTLSLVGPVSGH